MKSIRISKILLSIIMILTIVISLGQNVVNAADNTRTIKLDYKRGDASYALNNNNKPIFQIVSVNSNGTKTGTNYYCLNAAKGSTWVSNTVGTGVDYDKYYDLVNDKSDISKLTAKTYSDVVSNNYGPVMWILDNMHIDGGISITQLLAKAGIVKGDTGATDARVDGTISGYYYDPNVNPSSKFSKDLYTDENFFGNSDKGQYYGYIEDGKVKDVILSKDMVEAVQQAAIWYFTNSSNNSKYDCYTTTINNDWLRFTTNPSSLVNGWELLASETKTVDGENIKTGKMLQEQASILYNYFVEKAKTKTNYTSTSVGTLELSPEKPEIIIEGNNYKIGPLKIKTEGTVTINGEIRVTTGTSTDITSNATVSGTSKTNPEANKNFYVVIPRSSVKGEIAITVKGRYTATVKNLWIKKVTNDSNAEQPIVEIEKKSENVEDTVKVSPIKQFDLALRKIITKVNGKTSIINEKGYDAKRSININDNTIPDTAIYKHRKDPILVKTADTVTYEIRIYNEGDLDGYATKIVDQLPAGLISNLKTGDVVTSKTNKNTYTVKYNETTNKLEFTMNTKKSVLKAYDGTTLSSDLIEVDCTVEQKAETDGKTKHYLTNIAYIEEGYDAINNKVVTEDRDGEESKTTQSPSKTAEQLNNTDANNYKGNSLNESVYNDTNNDTYYKGEQDDDDFEKVVILPKEFDLKLIKYISAINNEPIQTKRKIDVDSSKLNKIINGKKVTTANYDVDKAPLIVEPGDYVTYTFRIYNEGDLDGYASEISENIPKGLEYDASVNTDNIWTLSNDGKTIITNNLSKEKGINNLIKAFDYENDDGEGSGLSYKEVSVKLKVVSTDAKNIIRNETAITEDSDEKGNSIDDRDSDTEKWKKEDSDDNYKNNSKYPKYKEDDEDYDNIKLLIPDLALRKFISKISEDGDFSKEKTTTSYDRAPKVDTTKLKSGEEETAVYNHSKEPIYLNVEDYVLYTIRVYNEGEVAGYASQIIDYLPSNLDFVAPEYTEFDYIKNINNKWEYDSETRKVTTKSDAENARTLLAAFDSKNDNKKGSGLSSVDVQIVCKVNASAVANKKLTNLAEISQYKNKNNVEISKDRDSTSNDLEYPSNPETYKDSEIESGKKYIPGQEDDDDFEKVIVRKPGTYDIILVKEDEDGEQLNSTATFEVNGETKTVKGKLTIAKDVSINGTNVDIPDVYTIKETKAPDKYCEFGGTIKVIANKKVDGTTYKLDSVSYEIRDVDGKEITTQDANIYIKNGNIYVEVKNYEEPEIHKGVKTVENQDSGYDKNEEQKWEIQSDIPGDIERYKKYEILDDIDYRLKYVENSVQVKIGSTKLIKDTDYKLEFDNASNDKKSGTLKVIFIGNNQEISSKLVNNSKKKIQLTFKTIFATDAEGNLIANLGTEIPNKAKLDFSNTANINREKETETPEIHTGGVTLYKYYKLGNEKKALKGVEFSIYKEEADAKANKNAIMTATSGEDGIVRFIGLEYGEDASDKETNKTSNGIYKYDSNKQSTKYWIAETKAPNKFELSSKIIEATVNATSYEEDIIKIPAKYQIENTKKPFDLKLIKYISKINDEESNRKITVDTKNLNKTIDGKTVTTADYNVTKVPLKVQTGDYVTYTFRVYNEGELDGYASEITEDIPEGLEYDASVNTNVDWTVSEDGKTIKTDYLSDKLIKAYNGETLDYKEVSVKLKVISKDIKNIIRNEAEISMDKDEDGEDVTDRDSKPEEWKKEDSDDAYENNPKYPKYKEDDEDYDNIKLVNPDLSLRKFIDKISSDGDFTNSKSTTTYSREPQVDTTKLKDGTATTAIYNHSKNIIDLNIGDYVLYTLRVYNEGEVAGYASQITDYLPDYLDFVNSSNEHIKSINDNWKYNSETRKVVTIQDAPNANKILKAFDSKNDNGKGSGLDYIDIQIICRVNKNAPIGKKLTNIAEISEYKNENKVVVEIDRDSTSNNLKYPQNPETYKDNEKDKKYVPGQEDDDDFEKVRIREPKKFDLALRKFITEISGKKVNTRTPQVSYKNNKIVYTHPKDVVKVIVGDIVTYTLRVYNEGEIAGYAEKITDDIPDFLEYLPDNNINKKYKWVMYDQNGKETTKVANAVKIVTDYTSKKNGEEFLLNAFDKTKKISNTNPNYVDVKVAFRVKDPDSSKYIITNRAQISEDADKDGNSIDDIDSTPDKWREGEDDQDYENISVEYFDLSLLKYVTKTIVTEKGKTKTTKTGNTGSDKDITPKVEIYRKSVYKTSVKFEYTIKVTNEGQISGYAKELKDYVPNGLRFYKEDNKGWKYEGNNVISTTLLKDTLLEPGQSATVKVILRWVNGENNLGLKTNIAEISKDYNEKGVPDKDSTPDNKKTGEDDIDDAPVLLTISTGILENPIPYVIGALVILSILGIGLGTIKKYVL